MLTLHAVSCSAAATTLPPAMNALIAKLLLLLFNTLLSS
jgi:hypothetical protein